MVEMSIKETDMIAIEKKKALKRSMLLEDALDLIVAKTLLNIQYQLRILKVDGALVFQFNLILLKCEFW